MKRKEPVEYLRAWLTRENSPDSVLRALQTEAVATVKAARTKPRSYADQDGERLKSPATVEDLCQCGCKFQKAYFNNEQVDAVVVISDTAVMKCAASFSPGSKRGGIIEVDSVLLGFPGLWKISLLHELVHMNLYLENGDPDEKHGKRFKSQIKRLVSARAYDSML
jgi:hypothetical protein